MKLHLAEAESAADKTTQECFSAFAVQGEEYKQNHLWLHNFNHNSVLPATTLLCF